ncbi:MAG: hypothetical protein CMM88_04970 [Rickettsiales bacterium]|mgnify:FL=1|nr:hypothetical protein [Rickettsiales bacterium]
MPKLIALSTSIAVLGAISTWFHTDLLAGTYIVWIGFVAWGAYFANGANEKSLKDTVVSGVFGAIVAMVALLLANNMPIGGDYNVPIWVGITVFVLVYSSQVAALSNIPTAVYGYAVMAGYSLLTGASATDLASATTANPLWAVAVSIVIGSVFGALSGRLSGALEK